ncbi:MAG TPA: hypothetical protein VMZ31_01405 [Phycisphaerae bacterium]|nr:hypothetical protein [Phycisphaerae bacterium]
MERSNESQVAGLLDHLDALGSVRAAHAVFFLLILLALLTQIVLYCAVRFEGVLTAEGGGPVAATATTQAARPSDAVDSDSTVAWRQAIAVLVPLSRFLGLIAACLLVISYFIGLNVCLAGRLGGARGMTSAFFWSVLLLALLFPWQHLLLGATVQVPGVFYSFEDLQQLASSSPSGMIANIEHYTRYLGYPVLAILIALVACLRFVRASRDIRRRIESAEKE